MAFATAPIMFQGGQQFQGRPAGPGRSFGARPVNPNSMAGGLAARLAAMQHMDMGQKAKMNQAGGFDLALDALRSNGLNQQQYNNLLAGHLPGHMSGAFIGMTPDQLKEIGGFVNKQGTPGVGPVDPITGKPTAGPMHFDYQDQRAVDHNQPGEPGFNGVGMGNRNGGVGLGHPVHGGLPFPGQGRPFPGGGGVFQPLNAMRNHVGNHVGNLQMQALKQLMARQRGRRF